MAVIIDGATGTLGATLVRKLDSLGEKLLLVGRSHEDLTRLQNSLQNPTNHRIFAWVTGEPLDLKSNFESTATEIGDFNSLIITSGAFHSAPVRNIRTKDYESLQSINAMRPLQLIQIFASLNKRTKESSIVAVSSISATSGEGGIASYAASKAALEAIAMTSASELARQNVRVNVVRAGLFDSSIAEGMRAKYGAAYYENIVSRHPLGLGKPDDIVDAILFLISSKAKWITGSVMLVDGGYSLG